MKSWMRIMIVVCLLVGSAVYFGYWSLGQFNTALNDLSASYASSILSVSKLPSKEDLLASTTSPELSASSTTTTELATTTEPISTTDLELSFIFPQKGDGVYIGCTYSIFWQSSTTLSSLDLSLVDAGTREVAGPIASGLSKENTIEKESQNLKWKVGEVWPGGYYILISKINGVEAEIRSKAFVINKIPESLSASEKENICKESDGSF